MRILRQSIFSIFAAGLLLSSCMKAKEDAIQDTEMLVASTIIDMAYEMDFSSGADQSAQNNSYHSSIEAESPNPLPCATITVETANDGGFPRTFTVDFGTGCEYNGITRSGILVITLSNYFMSPGSHMTIERQNYSMNDWNIAGSVHFVNETTDANMPQWTRSTSNSVFTSPVGLSYTSVGNRTVRQIEGYGNLDLNDNVYEISSGTHTVTKNNGSSMTINILSPIIKAMDCEYLSTGIMHVNGELLNGDIDYGEGECDNKAIYTHHNGLTFTINL